MTGPVRKIDRPILFSGPMVRAILDGRKTQTRRILNPQPPTCERFRGSSFGLDRAVADGVKLYSQNDHARLPKHPTKWDLIGSVGVARDAGFPKVYDVRFALGSRLWVREGHIHADCSKGFDPTHGGLGTVGYLADGEGEWLYRALAAGCRKRPSIHMPRWASRLTLHVTDVRVERLQDISEADAAAEGAYRGKASGRVADDYVTMAIAGAWFSTARAWYADLWNRINGPDAWAANPWVVAVTFDVVRANIDAIDRPACEEVTP